MRVHRAARAIASADSSFITSGTCLSRPRFLCLNAHPRAIGFNAAGKGREARRQFSTSRSLRSAEAVLKQAAADPSALTQEAIISNLDEVERGRLARIRNIGIAVCIVAALCDRKLNSVGTYR